MALRDTCAKQEESAPAGERGGLDDEVGVAVALVGRDGAVAVVEGEVSPLVRARVVGEHPRAAGAGPGAPGAAEPAAVHGAPLVEREALAVAQGELADEER